MILNRKIIIIIFLLSSLIFKTEISHGEDFDPDIYDGISKHSIIDKVTKDSPASVAGIKVGDVVVGIDDQKVYLDKDIFLALKNSKSQTIKVKVFRKNRIFDFKLTKLTPKINSSNEKIIGISISGKCTISLDDQGNQISFFKDQFYRVCLYKKIYLKEYKYLQNLKKTSPYYENYIDDKILVTKQVARHNLNNSSTFNFEKGSEYLLEAYNLSRENINIIKNSPKNSSTFAAYTIVDIEPASIAFKLGEIYLNLYRGWARLAEDEIDLGPYIDHKKGLKYMTIAANENHSKALHLLGKAYLEGDFGLKRNEKKAFNLIEKTARLGKTIAFKNLADFYLLGKGGVVKNYSKALVHYKLGSIRKFAGGEDFYDITLLHKHKRLPNDSKEYYNWLTQDLLNFKTSSSIERTGYFAMLFLKNYSEAYKWYHICSSKIKPKDWNKNWYGTWKRNINNNCSRKIAFLEKNLLTEKEIKSAKIAAKNWIKKNIN